VVQITVDSWRDAPGKLWQPNALASLHLPNLKLPDHEWVIADVTYQRGQAFQTQPIILKPFDADGYQALQPGNTSGRAPQSPAR
jgi:prophage tail gpP-like protein